MTLNLGTNPLTLILLSLFELLFIFLPSFIASKLSKKTIWSELKEIGFSNFFENYKSFLINVLFGLLTGICLFFISGYLLTFITNYIILPIFGIVFLQEGLKNAISTQPYYPSATELLILIIIQILVIGPCEEAFFRGFLITKFINKLNMRYSILLSSIIFTLYHIPPFLVPISTIITFFPYFFIIGLILGFIYVKFNRSLIACSVAHSIFNVLILLT